MEGLNKKFMQKIDMLTFLNKIQIQSFIYQSDFEYPTQKKVSFMFLGYSAPVDGVLQFIV